MCQGSRDGPLSVLFQPLWLCRLPRGGQNDSNIPTRESTGGGDLVLGDWSGETIPVCVGREQGGRSIKASVTKTVVLSFKIATAGLLIPNNMGGEGMPPITGAIITCFTGLPQNQ